MKIAVLALQGAFIEHEKCLDKIGIQHFEIRKTMDLGHEHDGIIIPGGESTVMSKLLSDLGLLQKIVDEIKGGMPVFGTCAGLILLANKVENEDVPGIKTMDIAVKKKCLWQTAWQLYDE